MPTRRSWLRRQFLSGLPLIGAFFVVSEVLEADESGKESSPKTDTGLAKQFKKLQREVDELRTRSETAEASVSTLSEFNPPVGSVIPYIGKWPASQAERDDWENASGWLRCDGRSLNKPQYSELKTALGGADSLPNFDGRVARGIAGEDSEGKPGGRDTVPAGTTGNAGKHSHPLPAWTGLMGIIPAAHAKNGKRYSVKDDNAGWVDNGGGNAHHIVVGGGNNDEGQHEHELGGNTGEQPDHAHPIPATTIIPSYIAVHYIVKFKSNSG